MTRNYLLTLILVFGTLTLSAQFPFKYDNTVYKAVYLNEAFRLMEASPNHLLLDVRSPGEYADTSASTALNIGRIKGALNINITDVPAHMTELKKYIDQPVFVYCSHSQRSRRVSKLLAENGFTKVYNINGGMSQVNRTDNRSFPYKNKVLEINTAYKNVASADAISLLTGTPGLVIIDIRTTQEFASKDTTLQNNIGRLKNAINIPQAVFAAKIDSYNLPVNKTILLYDMYGYNSMDVVDILRAKGYTHIYNLFEGLSSLASDHHLTPALRTRLFTGLPPYRLVNPKTAIDLLVKYPDMLILDTRSAEEFDNKGKHMNMGRIKGAVNVSTLESLENIITSKNKVTSILVYGAGDDFSMLACEALVKKGFTQVNFLNQGLYSLVWATANVEGCAGGKDFLVNHEGLY
jgi:rhodanese-related sulfurtransferase